MQSPWKTCLHGRPRTDSFNSKSSMQTLHWRLESAQNKTPNNIWDLQQLPTQKKWRASRAIVDHRAALILTQAEDVRRRIGGQCVAWCACLLPAYADTKVYSFREHSTTCPKLQTTVQRLGLKLQSQVQHPNHYTTEPTCSVVSSLPL